MLDEKLSDNLRERKFNALNRIRSTMNSFIRENLLARIILAAAEKKFAMLEKAETIYEISEIEKPSLPRYNGNELTGNGPYHVEEEELLFWCMVSPHNNLNNYATERYIKLFKKLLPEYDI